MKYFPIYLSNVIWNHIFFCYDLFCFLGLWIKTFKLSLHPNTFLTERLKGFHRSMDKNDRPDLKWLRIAYPLATIVKCFTCAGGANALAYHVTSQFWCLMGRLNLFSVQRCNNTLKSSNFKFAGIFAIFRYGR